MSGEPRYKSTHIIVIKLMGESLQELIDLAREMKSLDSFVHVSTAYAHCHLQNEVLQEKGRKDLTINQNHYYLVKIY